MSGYCMRCRETKEILDAEQVTMKGGNAGQMRRLRGHDVQDRQELVGLD